MRKCAWVLLIVLISSLFVFNQTTVSAPRQVDDKSPVRQGEQARADASETTWEWGVPDEASLQYREEHQNEPHDAEFLKSRQVNLAAEATALTITTNDDPNDLIDAFLIENSGIAVTSVSYTGDYRAAGLYSDGPFAIDDGIILATGRVTSALPPDNSGKTGTNLYESGCDWCDDLNPGYTSYDAAILEITFNTGLACSSISFDFVFGSEEYPEWVGSDYNDVFGAYLNGVQIAFDESGAPITINGPFFSGGYVQVPPDNGLEYDGTTLKLRTNATVTPGTTGNTLILVICDAGDHIYDSGVFLANLEGSGESTPCTGIPPQFDYPPTPTHGDTIYSAVDQLVTFDIQASDQGPNDDTVTVSVTGLPAGATMSPSLPVSGDPVSSTFSWTPSSADAGYHTLAFTANDLAPCFFAEECQIIICVDDAPPQITCPLFVSLDCGESTDPSNTGYATAVDDITADPIVAYTDEQQDNVITRTWTATDAAGNVSQCPQMIYLVGQAPALATDQPEYEPGNTILIGGSGFCPNELVTVWVEILGEAGTAICDGAWIVTTDANGYFPTDWFVCEDASGESLVVYATGQTSGVTTSVTVADCNVRLQIISLPSLVPPYSSFQVTARLEQKCSDGSYASLEGREILFFLTEQNCGVDVGQDSDATGIADINGEATVTLTSPATDFGVRAKFLGESKPKPCYPPGNSACSPGRCVNLSAANDCEEALVGQPCDLAITCPVDITIECDQSTDPSNTGSATATGYCTPITFTYSDQTTSGTCPQEYTITRTWIATDDQSNADTCVQTITVQDNTGPIITCPANITVECDESTDPSNTGSATATDNCDPSPTITHSDQQTGDVITRTWTAADACGNSSQCQQIITIEDSTAPVISCPADVTIACDASSDPANTGSATATDNCDLSPGITYTDSETPGTCAQEKTIARTWTAADDDGNSAQCQQIITVVDTTPPAITCPADVIVECDESTDPSNTGNATAMDNCDPAPVITYGDQQNGNVITRTWTATDDCGNSSHCQQLITIDDTTNPVITCPANVTVECDESTYPSNTGYATATDNCDATPTISYGDVEASGSCPQEKTITRTWTATDNNGNFAQCVQTITVEDNTAPILYGCPSNVTVECDNIPNPANVTATDNCDQNPTVTFNETSNLTGCGGYTGTITRTWTATDACGNQSQCTQVLTVVDTSDPVISCPGDVTISCDESTAPANTGAATASDNCDINPIITYSDSETFGSCDQEKTITRTWTATDVCGNSDVCVQTITVEDNAAPVLVGCPADVTVECDNIPSAASVTATDNCDPSLTVTFNETSDLSGCGGYTGTITRTWTATDDCGNESSCTQTITVKDNTDPVITCPVDVDLECDDSTDPSNTGYATATDNCDSAPTITYSDNQNNGVITRTWTATDACGNDAGCVQTITIDDSTPPVITCPADVTVECGQSTDPSSTGYATATDNCDPDPVIQYSDSQTGDVITRTWTATDDGGNWASCDQIITIEDTTPPVITCPVDMTVECDESTNPPNTGSAIATDNCDPSPVITHSDQETAGSCAEEKTITRTWTATDNAGNSSSCQQMIMVEDTEAPVITCPAEITIECDQLIGPVNTGYATAIDNCDPDPEITHADSEIAGSCDQEKTIIRTWTVTDNCGNQAVCVQMIHVVDTTPPKITCPTNVTIICDESSDPANTGSATATDNCDPAPMISSSDSETPGSCPEEKTITRTWTATDDCGNSVQCVQVITVIDNVPPTLIGCPADATAECDNIPAAAAVTATDNCDPNPSVTLVETPYLTGCGGYTGIIQRTWTATDACGNESSCSQVITVVDTAPPTFSNCPADITVDCDNIPDPPIVVAEDNCSGIDTYFTEIRDLSACGNYTGTITRIWTATDGCGNQAVCTQVLTVVDNTDPVITCPDDITIECGESSAPANTGTATATDNCDPNPTVTYTDAETAGACPQEKTITRTWTATDACGNSSSCDQIITVQDTEAPVISGPAGTIINCDQSIDPQYTGQATAEDNCDPAPSVDYSDTETAGSCPQEKTITRTWTASDACGNSAEFVQTIVLQDTIAPVLIGCPSDATYECSEPVPPPPEVTATDNCDPDPVISIDATFDLSGCGGYTGTITRVWTATDACGNQYTCTQVLTFVDTQPPVITCPEDVSIECLADVPPCDPALATASDNCDAEVTITCQRTDNGGSGTLNDPLIITDTYTVTDDCDNSATCQRTITVMDDQGPVLSGCPDDVTVECDTIPDEATVTATDLCGPNPTVVFDADTVLVEDSNYCIETITRTWTAADIAGNQTSCSQVITVVDTHAPVITGPGNQTNTWTDGLVTLQVEATDNCSDPTDFTYYFGTVPPGGAAKVASMPGLALDPQTGVITYDPDCIHVPGSPYDVLVFINDGRGNIGQHNFAIAVTNTVPTITCPADITQWYSYEGEIRETVTAGDPDGDPVTVGIQSVTWFGEPVGIPPGMAIEGSYEFVWDPDWLEEGGWVITLDVDDGCQQSTCSFAINVTGKFRFDVTDTCVYPGYNAEVFITSTNTLEIGGLDLLLSYDQSGLRFLSAEPWGDELPLWEYFTYRSSAMDNCGGGCPTGLIRIIAIADLPNGMANPPAAAFHPDGKIVKLTFATTEDRSFIGQCFWIEWAWFDCGDNTLSSKLGDTLFVAQEIYRLLPDENCTEDIEGKGIAPVPSLDFVEGAVCICPPPDDRGDINLNGLANEIADAVLFSNYFIYGPEVLGYGIDEYYENRVLATDINDDGTPLTIADLVYLIRIITGDAIPYGESGEGGGYKMTPLTGTGSTVYLERDGDIARILADVSLDMGAIAFTLKVDGLEIGAVEATERSAEMAFKSGQGNDGLLRVLVYSLESRDRILAGNGVLVEIPISGEGSIELTAVDASDRSGRVLRIDLARTPQVPDKYELLQNYPNPFNAGTVIRFRLPQAADWQLLVYDIAGRLVREFTGHAEPGEISVNWDGRDENGQVLSSGMYFYRMAAASFNQTRKMVLVK